MQILLSCAKDMTDTAAATDLSTTQPIFQREAEQTAMQLTRYSADELAEMLHVNPQLAALNKLRYS
ncbi:MAG: peroxide stress protein YaaA, partial [Hoylesella buccalis]